MELGLSLGDSSTPFVATFMEKQPGDSSTPFVATFMEKQPRESSSNELGLGFNTTLSIGPIIATQRNQEAEEDEAKTKRNEQLDLLPQLTFPWPPPSQNVSSRGLDVNVLPPAVAVATAEDEAVLSSSPNSAASSFRMDLCIYSRGGGGGSLSGSGGNKRDFSDGEGYDQRASSRASDEDDNGGGGGGGAGNTRKKLRLSKDQSAFLEESFKEHNTLNPKQKLALAKQLNLRPRQVEVWFQNRRARTKLKQTEVDCEYLKRCCETLTEENRRLHKELQELRALKTSNPFYMQSPATTLTMCPSCERVATNSTTTSSVTTSANAKTSDDSTSKANIGFPFGKPRFHPFSHTSPQHLELN